MANAFDNVTAAISEAIAYQNAVADNSRQMAVLLRGNLHHVSDWVLKELKDELRRYNAHTCRWKP